MNALKGSIILLVLSSMWPVNVFSGGTFSQPGDPNLGSPIPNFSEKVAQAQEYIQNLLDESIRVSNALSRNGEYGSARRLDEVKRELMESMSRYVIPQAFDEDPLKTQDYLRFLQVAPLNLEYKLAVLQEKLKGWETGNRTHGDAPAFPN